jgi:CHAT domain
MMRERGRQLEQQGLRLCQRYDSSGQPDHLIRGITLLHEALAHADGTGQQAIIWGNLGTALSRYFELTNSDAALNDSIALLSAAITSGVLGGEDLMGWTHALRHSLRARFDKTGERTDIDAAIMLSEQLRSLPAWFRPPPDIWASWLSESAEDREERARRPLPAGAAEVPREALADVDAAVELRREVIDASSADYPDPAGLLSNLGGALTLRAVIAGSFGREEQASADLAEALDLQRAAARQVPETHPYATRIIGNLCGALLEQVQRTGDRALLDEAAVAARRNCRLAGTGEAGEGTRALLLTVLAARAAGANDPGMVHDLIDALEDPSIGGADAGAWPERRLDAAEALSDHFWLTGDVASLTRAIAHCRAILSEPGEQAAEHRQAVRSVLSMALRDRYEHAGEEADLTEATELARSALSTATGARERAERLEHLGVCLMLGAGTNPASLAEGIAFIRQAISELPAGPPGEGPEAAENGQRTETLGLSLRTNLSVALRTRYEETHDLADLDEAIGLARGSVTSPSRAAEPSGHGNDLASLGIALQIRYRHTGSVADLDEAIQHCREAARVLPAGHPRRAEFLSSLGLALQLRYGETGQAADLDEAVETGHAAVSGIPEGEHRRFLALSSVGLAHRLRSELTGSEEDLREAIDLGRAAVAAAGTDQAPLTNALHNLARAVSLRWERHRAPADLREAIAGFRRVAGLPGAPRQVRLNAAVSWARLATRSDDWPEAATAYETAVDLLELVVWHGLPRAVREEHLADLPGLASDAAASALAAGDAQRALSVLERGRSVLWTQHLHLRSSFDDVRDAAPGLHQRLKELATELTGDDPAADVLAPGHAAPGADDRRQRLAAAWDETLAQVRALPGLAGTLRPPSADELVAGAAGTPVAVLNVSNIRSDALILTGQGITVLPLPGVTPEEIRQRAIAHLEALNSQNQLQDPRAYLAADHAILAGIGWLQERITGPVIDELERVAPPPSAAAGARVRWCPAGLLGLLPLHAAAHDRVTSSYTPTVRSLLAGRDRDGAPGAVGDGPMLVVAVSEPPAEPGEPALPPIPGVDSEAELVCARFAGRHTLRTGGAATREQIRTDLPAHPLAHFACHGTQDLLSPSRAALRLCDGPLSVLEVAELRLSGDLAFLSACDTAAGGFALPDEAIHLAAAVQTAGYRNVIAALWQISDNLAPRVADIVYRSLAEHGSLDGDRTAGALHTAVDKLRSEFPGRPSLWACYAHFGP